MITLWFVTWRFILPNFLSSRLQSSCHFWLDKQGKTGQHFQISFHNKFFATPCTEIGWLKVKSSFYVCYKRYNFLALLVFNVSMNGPKITRAKEEIRNLEAFCVQNFREKLFRKLFQLHIITSEKHHVSPQSSIRGYPFLCTKHCSMYNFVFFLNPYHAFTKFELVWVNTEKWPELFLNFKYGIFCKLEIWTKW